MVFVRLGFIALFMTMAGRSKAQYTTTSSMFIISVSPASVIRIYPTTPITLYMGPIEAGSVSSNSTNSDSYLKATSITSGNNKKVDVQITNGNVPTGTLLKVKAHSCTTGSGTIVGSGTFGSVNSQKTLSKTSSETIIQGMGTCFTGNGPTDGYNLTYSWVMDTNVTAQLIAYSTAAIFITYTITLY